MGDPQAGAAFHWPDLEFGPAVSSHDLTFIPVLEGEKRDIDYLLLEEAIQEKAASVREVSEQGSVPVLEVENRHDRPILILQGEELVGAKQDRTLNVSILLPPGRTHVPVTCVEQGRWRYKSREFFTGVFEHYALRRMKAEQVSRSRKRKVASAVLKYAADQGEVWGEVDRESSRQAVRSSTSALGDVYGSDQVKPRLDEMVKSIQLPESACGVAVEMNGEMVALEVMESPRLFRKIWPRLLRSYALGSLARSAMGPAEGRSSSRTSSPQDLIAASQAGAASVEDSVGLGQDVRWEAPGALAVALFHEGRMVHGTIYPRARPEDLGLA